MEMREWLSILVILVVVVIILDGFRSRWLDRKNRVVIKLDKGLPESEEYDYDRNSELPSKTRTVSREGGSFSETDESSASSSTRSNNRVEPSFSSTTTSGSLHDDLEFSAATALDKPQVTEVLVLNVMAKSPDVLAGREILPILLQAGMRLGEMSIFHCHADNEGPIIFSMANMVEPGTFEINEMDNFSTPGISFFLQLPSALGNMDSFERMLEVAKTIKEKLNADLKDENRSVITAQTIEHCRQRILDFELAQLTYK